MGDAIFVPRYLKQQLDVEPTLNPSTDDVLRFNGTKWDKDTDVISFNGRTGAVLSDTNDYTWAQVNKAVSSLADVTTRSHTLLTDIGTNTHPQIDTHLGSTANPHSTTYLGLTDTPSSFTANRIPFTNVGGTALTDSANLTFTGTILVVSGTAPAFQFTDTDGANAIIKADANLFELRGTGAGHGSNESINISLATTADLLGSVGIGQAPQASPSDAKLAVYKDYTIPAADEHQWEVIRAVGISQGGDAVQASDSAGVIGLSIIASDNDAVIATPGLRRRLYGADITVTPKTARGGVSSADDVVCLHLSNSGTVSGTDCIYIAPGSAGWGKILECGANAITFIQADAAYTNGIYLANSTFSAQAMTVPNNSWYGGRNQANSANINIAKVNASNAAELFDGLMTLSANTVDIQSTAPIFTLTDTTALAKSLKIDVDANIAQIREKAGAANSLMSFDLVDNKIGLLSAPLDWAEVSLVKVVNTGGFGIGIYSQYNFTGTDASAIRYAIYGDARVIGSGVCGDCYGMYSSVDLYSTASCITASGIQIYTANSGTGTVTNAYGVHITNFFGSGPVTNIIGIRIARNAGSRTRKYGLYYGSAAVGSEPTGNYAAYFDVDPVAVGNAVVTGGVADAVKMFSTDDAPGHTIPSFYCEGTNVLATGQADSASATRVKMRINGTVVTLLAI